MPAAASHVPKMNHRFSEDIYSNYSKEENQMDYHTAWGPTNYRTVLALQQKIYSAGVVLVATFFIVQGLIVFAFHSNFQHPLGYDLAKKYYIFESYN